jgi:hypothetical protein
MVVLSFDQQRCFWRVNMVASSHGAGASLSRMTVLKQSPLRTGSRGHRLDVDDVDDDNDDNGKSCSTSLTSIALFCVVKGLKMDDSWTSTSSAVGEVLIFRFSAEECFVLRQSHACKICWNGMCDSRCAGRFPSQSFRVTPLGRGDARGL